jgi:predicted phosphodiesterase
MKEIQNILLSRQINPRLLYKIVVVASCCFLIILSLLFPAHIVFAQEGDDSLKTTKKPSKTNFNFAAAGDWGCTDDTRNTVDNIVDKNPELVLGLGDFSYEPTADCWLDIIQPIDNTIDNAMKIVIGNHDVEDLQNYMNHFGLAREYYSFDIKNVHFIALATEEEYLDFSNDIAKEQLAFVKNDLEKASTNPDIDWIIPFFHRLMYYDDNGECDNLVDEYDHNLVDLYHPLFEKYGVNLVLHGHAHTYERTYSLKFNFGNSEQPIVTSEDSSNYRSEDGLVIATVGTGGSKFTETCLIPELAAVQYANLFGFLNVDVSADGTKLVGTFYDNADGEIKDTFTITKSSVPSAEKENADDNNDHGNKQKMTKGELQSESEKDNPTTDEEVSTATESSAKDGNEEFSTENQDNEYEYDIGLDNIDSYSNIG